MPGSSPGMTEERGARSDNRLCLWDLAFRQDISGDAAAVGYDRCAVRNVVISSLAPDEPEK
jgi:hypothetical protein